MATGSAVSTGCISAGQTWTAGATTGFLGSCAAPTPAPAAEPAPDATAAAEKEIDPATKEALDLDRFVKYLKKQEGNIARVKIILKALNLSMHDADPADKSNFFKMMRTASVKQLAKLSSEETSNKQSE